MTDSNITVIRPSFQQFLRVLRFPGDLRSSNNRSINTVSSTSVIFLLHRLIKGT